jgi:transcriptional regulator with XRE-family HTH domain
MTTNWRDLRAETITTPEAEREVDLNKMIIDLEQTLAALRAKCGITQETLAERIGTSRPNVSRIERGGDVRLSTLKRYVEALDGKLEISVTFSKKFDADPDEKTETIGSTTTRRRRRQTA